MAELPHEPATGATGFNMGSLRSQIQMELHTFHSVRLWNGRRPSGDDRGVIGITTFLAILNLIKFASANDDPYADQAMIDLELKIVSAKDRLTQMQSSVQKILEQIPKQISVSDNLNVQPLRLPLFVNSPLGFQTVYLLTQYDHLTRQVLLAHHVGLISRQDKDHLLDTGAHEVRSVMGMGQRYKNAGVTRAEMQAGGARAQDAIAKFGELPPDILDGTRRSQFAPPVTRPSGIESPPEVASGTDAVDEVEPNAVKDEQE